MRIRFTLNGKTVQVDAEPETRLSEILLHELAVASLRQDCSEGRCGSCLVIFEGMIVSSCMIPMFRVLGTEVTTVEGLFGSKDLRDIERGFQRSGFEPCRYCAAPKTLLTHAIISENTSPREEELQVQAQAVRCRCTSYQHFLEAIRNAAKQRRSRSGDT
ncbi:MAG: hypothetical protein EA383_03545 [Spirochaetaceae bacterium]|nr:MAG: hypothetical protein EA383_03545 [Spirochaetaceae bacterium]